MPYAISIDTSDPIGFLYKLMTEPSPHSPEVSIVSMSGEMSFYTPGDLPTVEKFRAECAGAVITAMVL